MILKKLGWTAALVLAATLAAVQFVPAKRTNPVAQGGLVAPPEVTATLRRACYDCHSYETRWPWYSRIAPVSWIVIDDVTRARNEVNFSRWGSYYPITRHRKLEWIGRVLREERMPPRSYVLMHPDARLTAANRTLLERWIASALGNNSTEGQNK